MNSGFAAHKAYLQALLSVVAADGLLDKQEVLKLYELFALFKFGANDRRVLFERLVASPGEFQASGVKSILLVNDSLKLSLAKDLSLMLERSSNDSSLRAARRLLLEIDLTKEQSNVIEGFILVENKILAALGAGENWHADDSSWRHLVARAAALGAPVASRADSAAVEAPAAAIASGLAALGEMSGMSVLGLSPMTAGVGALILGGVDINKVAKYAFDSGDESVMSQLEEFDRVRSVASKYLRSDLDVVGRRRKREVFNAEIRRRRSALRESMCDALRDLG